jgi:hypothetical protein
MDTRRIRYHKASLRARVPRSITKTSKLSAQAQDSTIILISPTLGLKKGSLSIDNRGAFCHPLGAGADEEQRRVECQPWNPGRASG